MCDIVTIFMLVCIYLWTYLYVKKTLDTVLHLCMGFFYDSVGKDSICNSRDPSSIPGWGRSCGKGHGNSIQYSCLENPMAEEPSGP